MGRSEVVVSMTDSRGGESKTLGMVWFLLIAATVAFIGGRIPITGMVPMTGGQFSAIITPILGAWLGREWTEKRK